MTWQGWAQIAVFAALVTAAVKPLGLFILRSLDGHGRVLRAMVPVENGLYRLAGIDPRQGRAGHGSIHPKEACGAFSVPRHGPLPGEPGDLPGLPR